MLVGDFNCKEIDWEIFESNSGDNAWRDRFLRLMMENLMIQRVNEHTRYRSDDEPARLDLVLTIGIQIKDELRYGCPLGKSDHVTIEIDTEVEVTKEDESYKSNRLNYIKTDMENLRKFYEKVEWDELLRKNKVQEKYDIFMEAYNTGVKKYVPVYRPKVKGRKDWFNAKCANAKEKRDKAWKRLKEGRIKETKKTSEW